MSYSFLNFPPIKRSRIPEKRRLFSFLLLFVFFSIADDDKQRNFFLCSINSMIL